MVDEPRSHWGRGWKVFLGIGALLEVLFAFGDLSSKLRDACNGWGIDVCRDRYAVRPTCQTLLIERHRRGRRAWTSWG